MTDNPQVRRVTARFDTPNDAAMWMDTVPRGWRVLFSEMSPAGAQVVVQVTVVPDPFTVPDVKALFAAHGIDVDPIDRR